MLFSVVTFSHPSESSDMVKKDINISGRIKNQPIPQLTICQSCRHIDEVPAQCSWLFFGMTTSRCELQLVYTTDQNKRPLGRGLVMIRQKPDSIATRSRAYRNPITIKSRMYRVTFAMAEGLVLTVVFTQVFTLTDTWLQTHIYFRLYRRSLTLLLIEGTYCFINT